MSRTRGVMGSRLTRIMQARRRQILSASVAAFAAVLVAGCGGDDSGSTVAASDATVSTREVSGFGPALATSAGQPLFLLTADPKGASKCEGKCAKTWVPLTAAGKPTAGPDVDAGKLSTFKRADGTVQVLYNGHALYTHTGPATASWAGTESDGGIWYLVSPKGEAIEATTTGGY